MPSVSISTAAPGMRSWTSRAATHVASGWNSSMATCLAPLPFAMKTRRRPETGPRTADPAATRKKSWWEARGAGWTHAASEARTAMSAVARVARVNMVARSTGGSNACRDERDSAIYHRERDGTNRRIPPARVHAKIAVHTPRELAMTKLDKPLKRELLIDRKPYVLTIEPDRFKLALKGHRKGLELAWSDLVSGEA